jgi:hypothetical protein
MSFIQSTQPIIIPDPLDPNYGPSADNIPIPSSSPGAPVTNTVGNGNAVKYYTVAASLFPQPSSTSNYTYRFTFNGSITAGTTTGTGGNIIISARLYHTDTTYDIIATQSCYASTSVSPTQSTFSLSALFIPKVGDTIEISVYNYTGGSLSGATLTPSTKGCGIELVSKASAPVLIFS